MAASSPRVVSNLDTETCRFVKRNFAMWASEFLRTSKDIEDTNIDIIEIAQLFQAFKFHINNSKNDNVFDSGIRIEITCLKSKKSVALIREEILCSCIEGESSAWEVTATSQSQQSLVEVGCSEFPPLQAEYALVVKNILAYAVSLTKEAAETNSSRHVTGRRNIGDPRLSLDSVMNSGSFTNAPSRYRSLDTLIRSELTSASPPETLVHPGTLSFSKSDASIRTSKTSNLLEVSPMVPEGAKRADLLSFLQFAMNNLSNAIGIINNSSNTPSAMVKSVKEKSKSPTVRTTNVKQTVSKFNSTAKHASNTSATTNITTSRISTVKPTGLLKKKDKYAHVQSTIPKPTRR